MKKRKSKIKAIIFDVGGVLSLGIHPVFLKDGKEEEPGVSEYMAKKFRVSFDQYLDAIDTFYAGSITGTLSRSKVLGAIARNLKTTQAKYKKLYKTAIRKNFKTNTELYNIASNLKKQGYKIAILSDQWHLSKDYLMPKKLTNRFDVVITSCDVGIRKPNPKIFRMTSKKLKIPASQSIFIDNQKWNIDAAKKLGFKTIQFKNNKQTQEELNRMLK